jgi:transitional endoplasmic reticulum ATPase
MGEQLILPESMEIPQAISLLERRMTYLHEKTSMSETFKVFPWDGANAVEQVLRKRFGWATQEKTPGFFRDNPPQLIAIDVGPDEVRNVPWGRFSLPTVDGYVECGAQTKEGLLCFALRAIVKRKDEATIKSLFADVREYLKSNSIYRGKAIKIRFTDNDGDDLEMPEPKFMRTDDVNESLMVFPDALYQSINTNLFTPIARHKDLKSNGIPLKRGVLLGGPYGTGKTLAAKVAAKKAVEAGATFIYVARAEELAQAVAFATQYQNPLAVVFCEDIDRAMHGERTVAIDDILNIIDGIDTKSASLMVILTTNHLENISPAMLRPGRLDAVIEVTPPDEKAVERLIRVYSDDALPASVDLKRVGEALAGRIPAVIAEVVKRAKLSQLAIQQEGQPLKFLTEDALLEAAQTMNVQLKLLSQDRTPPKAGSIDTAVAKIVQMAVAGTAS